MMDHLKTKPSIVSIVNMVAQFFNAVDTLKLDDETVNNLIVRIEEQAKKDESQVDQIYAMLLIEEQIAREMDTHS